MQSMGCILWIFHVA